MGEQNYSDFCFDYESDHDRRPSAFDVWQELQQQISASKAREAELREKLEAAKKMHADEQEMRIAEEKLRRAAEAIIKASQEQEPVAYLNIAVWKHAGYDSIFATPERAFDNQDALYTQPPIQPELAELQRELDRWKNSALTPREESMQREHAELTRKLAEQQAAIVVAIREAPNVGKKSPIHAEIMAGIVRMLEAMLQSDSELRKLLEESKVPEVTDEMALAFHRALTDGSIGSGEVEEIKTGLRAAMLSAQPKEPNQ